MYSGVELLGHIVFLLFVFWGTTILFFIMAVTFHFQQQFTRVPFSPHPYQHLLFVVFWTTAILTGLKWCYIVLLMCISLLVSTYWPSACLLWKKCLIGTSAHFLNQVVCFSYWVVWAVYLYWILAPYQTYHLQVFSPVQGLPW